MRSDAPRPAARDRRPDRWHRRRDGPPGRAPAHPASTATAEPVDPAHPPQDGGSLAGDEARRAVAPPGAHRPGGARDRLHRRGRLLAGHRRAPRPRRRGARGRSPRSRPARPGLGRDGGDRDLARIPTGSCATRCSTSATSPASARCTPPSSASSAASIPRPRWERCRTCAGWCAGGVRCSCSTRSAPSSRPPATSANESGCGSTAATSRRAAAVAHPSRSPSWASGTRACVVLVPELPAAQVMVTKPFTLFFGLAEGLLAAASSRRPSRSCPSAGGPGPCPSSPCPARPTTRV